MTWALLSSSQLLLASFPAVAHFNVDLRRGLLAYLSDSDMHSPDLLKQFVMMVINRPKHIVTTTNKLYLMPWCVQCTSKG